MSVFIVAEAGVNHLGDRAKMLALCDAAKAAGADAVKFQAFKWGQLRARRNICDEDTLRLLRDSQLTDADLDAIAAHCKAIGLKWFASVFDPSQVGRVLSRGACALKIGHAEAGWDELLEACRAACDMGVRTWVSSLGNFPRDGVVYPVYCVEEYPATSPPLLGNICPRNSECVDYRGFSSHYQDYRIPAAAALRGAEYIEAHLMLGDGELVGETFEFSEPEAAWSLSPAEFAEMVKLIRLYESWM